MTERQGQLAQPTQAGIHRRLVVGWISKGMGIGITFGEQILLVPVFLVLWGPERYGDWLVLLSTAGFIALLDTGLQTYYANAMQASLSRNQPDAFHRLFHQGTALYATILCVSLPLVGLAVTQADWNSLLNLREAGANSTQEILLVLALYFLITLPFGMANAVYRAHGHFATSIMVGNLVRLGLLAAVALSLWTGGSMAALSIVYVVVTLASWAAMIAHQKKRYADLRYGVAWPNRAAFKDLLSVAPLYAVIPAAMLITAHATVIMISTLAAAGKSVVMYTTMRTLTGIARMVMDQIMHVTGVEIARQYAEDDARALKTLYDFVGRLAGGICGTLAGLIAFIGPPFLAIWTVGKVPFDAGIFWPLLATAGFAGPSVAGVSVLLFINKPGGMARAHAIAAGTVLCLGLLLIPSLGAAGAAWSVLIAETCVLSILMPIQAGKIIGGSALRQIVQIQVTAIAAFAISGTGAAVAQLVTGDHNLTSLVGMGFIWALLVVVPLYYLLFNKSRREWIADRIRERLPR